jgi:hypothetical protein
MAWKLWMKVNGLYCEMGLFSQYRQARQAYTDRIAQGLTVKLEYVVKGTPLNTFENKRKGKKSPA